MRWWGMFYICLCVTKKLPRCDDWYKIIGALSVLGRASVIVITTIRTYAIYDRNRFVLYTLGALASSCVAFDVTHVPGLKCAGSSPIPIVPELLAITACVFDVFATSLLIFKVLRMYHVREKLHRGTLMSFVLQQGLLYFCGVFVFQFSTILLNFLAKSFSISKLLNALTLPFSCTLASRFLLDLQTFKDSQYSGRDPATSTSVTGNTIVWQIATSGWRDVVEDLSDAAVDCSGTALVNVTVAEQSVGEGSSA